MQANVVVLRVADLGFADGATTSEIIGADDDTDEHGQAAPFTSGRGKPLGLELCPPQIAAAFRLEYKDQPLGERVYVAMRPAATAEGERRIFVLGRNADGLFLDAARARPDDRWYPTDKFLFCLGGEALSDNS